jgi:hypothetical protein
VLNQIDATVAGDNSDEVYASRQRALAQSGLTAGSCYAIYIPELAVPIADAATRARYESKRDANLRTIFQRIEQVGVQRAYRIIGMLEQTAHMLESEVVPRLQRFLSEWRRMTLWLDGFLFGGLLALFLIVTIYGGYWDGLSLRLPLWVYLADYPTIRLMLLALLAGAVGYAHFSIRRWASQRVARRLAADPQVNDFLPNYVRAFHKNSRWFRSIFRRHPAGWGDRTARSLAQVSEDSQLYVQKLNDLYANPSGEPMPAPAWEPMPSPERQGS